MFVADYYIIEQGESLTQVSVNSWRILVRKWVLTKPQTALAYAMMSSMGQDRG